MSSSYYYTSTTSSSTSSTTTAHRYTTSSHTTPDGTTTVRITRQDLGEPTIVEEHRYDSSGQELATIPGDTLAGGVRRITEVEDEELPSEQSQSQSQSQEYQTAPFNYRPLWYNSKSEVEEDPSLQYTGVRRENE